MKVKGGSKEEKVDKTSNDSSNDIMSSQSCTLLIASITTTTTTINNCSMPPKAIDMSPTTDKDPQGVSKVEKRQIEEAQTATDDLANNALLS